MTSGGSPPLERSANHATGSPTRPESEPVAADAGTAGEVTATALANSSLTEHHSSPTGRSGARGRERRGSSRVHVDAIAKKVDPLAEANRQAHEQVRAVLDSPPAKIVHDTAAVEVSAEEGLAFYRSLAKKAKQDKFLELAASMPPLPTSVMACPEPPRPATEEEIARRKALREAVKVVGDPIVEPPAEPATATYDIVRASAKLQLVLLPLKAADGTIIPADYKELYQALYETRRQCAHAANVLVQKLWIADAAALAASRLQAVSEPAALGANGKPKTKSSITWAKLGATAGALNTYQVVRDAVPELASGIAASISKKVTDRWVKKRFDILVKMSEAVPFYRQDGSFPIRAQSFRLTHKEKNLYEVTFSLHAGRHENKAEFRVAVQAHDEYQHVVLHSLASQAWKVGDMIIEQDRRRKSRWYVRFAYTKQITREVNVKPKVAAINRGILTFLACVTEDGKRKLYDGNGIRAKLKQLQRRRQQFQREGWVSNRGGHGRARALEGIKHLEGKGERWRATQNQTLARGFVRWLSAEGVSVLRMEDFTGIRDQSEEKIGKVVWDMIQEWPFYDLGTRLRSCCEEAGISVEVVAPAGGTQTCSFCGHKDPANVKVQQRRMECVRCKRKEHLDVNAARNMLVWGAARDRDGVDRKMDVLESLKEVVPSSSRGKGKGAGVGAKGKRKK